jgi:hypothetical protein
VHLWLVQGNSLHKLLLCHCHSIHLSLYLFLFLPFALLPLDLLSQLFQSFLIYLHSSSLFFLSCTPVYFLFLSLLYFLSSVFPPLNPVLLFLLSFFVPFFILLSYDFLLFLHLLFIIYFYSFFISLRYLLLSTFPLSSCLLSFRLVPVYIPADLPALLRSAPTVPLHLRSLSLLSRFITRRASAGISHVWQHCITFA